MKELMSDIDITLQVMSKEFFKLWAK